jgi:hypothetical protein
MQSKYLAKTWRKFFQTFMAVKKRLSPLAYEFVAADMVNGTYYIYATFSDGLNNNSTYARWPVVIDHSVSAPPTISLN